MTTYDLVCADGCGTVLGTSTVPDHDGHLCEDCGAVRQQSATAKAEADRERRAGLLQHFQGVLSEAETHKLADFLGLSR